MIKPLGDEYYMKQAYMEAEKALRYHKRGFSVSGW